jgi:hypothetical protein
MYRIAGIVASSIAIPTTPVASSEVVLFERPREPKIYLRQSASL